MAATAAAHAPVPDASVGPTPRSQIRILTRSGCFDRGELDVRALGEMWVDRQRPADRVQALFGDISKHDALRVADTKRHCGHALTSDVEGHLLYSLGLSHRGAERVTAVAPAEELERLHAGVGLDVDEDALRELLGGRNPRGETAHAVAGNLRAAAVGVEELHGRAGFARLEDDQPVGADSSMPIAHVASERQRIRDAREVEGIDQQEVIAEGVRT